VTFLEKVEAWLPQEVGRVYAIADNLSSHRATDALLFLLAHPRWEMVFQPTYAAYLNLIEPWWKILRSLALAGRRFETWDEVTAAIAQATEYWNAPRHPFVWGHPWTTTGCVGVTSACGSLPSTPHPDARHASGSSAGASTPWRSRSGPASASREEPARTPARLTATAGSMLGTAAGTREYGRHLGRDQRPMHDLHNAGARHRVRVDDIRRPGCEDDRQAGNMTMRCVGEPEDRCDCCGVADYDGGEPVGGRLAGRERLLHPGEADRLISERRQHFLVPEK
jgi:hypothetical protein